MRNGRGCIRTWDTIWPSLRREQPSGGGAFLGRDFHGSYDGRPPPARPGPCCGRAGSGAMQVDTGFEPLVTERFLLHRSPSFAYRRERKRGPRASPRL
jgi:hypothetical protein